MNKIAYLLSLLYLSFLLIGCDTKTSSGDEKLPYNAKVEAFTSGKISRYSPVYLIFNQEISTDKQDVKDLKKKIKIKPEVEGEFFFENNKTIVFKPAKTFKRNTTYQVTADLSEWFDVEGRDKKFSFKFTTYPYAIAWVKPESIDINEQNETGYDIVYSIYTADKENPAEVEALVNFSEKVQSSWQHSSDGKRHQLSIINLPAGAEKNRKFVISVVPNKLDIPIKELGYWNIPSVNGFGIFDAVYKTEPEQYVEVTFTKTLDATQDMEGLAFISGNVSESVNVDGNKLRLYPDAQSKGVFNVHLNRGIRSKDGNVLEESLVRQVEINTTLPEVRFIGKGVIIPQSTELNVPFQSVYLRGVVVRVIKVLEKNIGQFLQEGFLDRDYDLIRVGRIVARKTLFFDENGEQDFSQWRTYAIDLKQLINPEPGAIYRIELSFNKDLSTYPCNNSVRKTKEQLLAEDKIKFKEESERFDEGGYYYYTGDMNWNDYNYKEREDPCSDSYYFRKTIGRNVLATNLGLMAMAGEDKTMTVLVHNLLTTAPEKGVTITAYNFQHQLLATRVTGEDGRVQLPLELGKPYYLIASLGEQRSYLRVDAGSALSLSSFDVSGEVVQKGVKGFIYGDRGVWRPGDTLHLGFILNDREKTLPADHPVVMELYNPLGQLYLRKMQTRGELGMYAFNMPTETDAQTGVWNVAVRVGGASFSKNLRIESIKPNRLKINLSVPEKVLLKGEPLNERMHVEWLQGAIARNLKYDIQGTFISTPTSFDGYKGFCFDNPSKTFNSEESKVISGRTDENGNALIDARFEVGTSAPGMLLANLVTRVYEESGDFSIDANRILYSPYKQYVGIKSPQTAKEQLNTGEKYGYDIVSLDYTGKPKAGTRLEVAVYKVEWYWWWSSDQSNLANYMADSYNKPVRNYTLVAGADGKASFSLSFNKEEWGTYFIVAKDLDGNHTSGVMTYFDWPDSEGRRDAGGSSAATLLSFKTDKDTYAPGEQMVITLPSSKGSRAIVSLENGIKVLSVTEHACMDNKTVIKLDVTPDMQPNIYVYVTLLQPHGVTKNDLPIRLYGVVPVTVTSQESHLTPVIGTPEEIKPESSYEITVSEKSGREMAYTLAVVDEGLLDLTRFRTPNPWKAFNAREALGVSTWDLYNYVVGAYGGRIEQLFSIGGDDALNKGPKAIVNRFKPVVQFDGPYVVQKGKKRTHTYTMPNYNGRVRVMVVAGNGQAYGNAEKSVMVRKPVMLLGTLPRVIGVGEEMVVPATVFATEDGVGDVKVSISCSSNMNVVGDASQTLYFDKKGDKQALFRIQVQDMPGVGKVTITAMGKGEKTVYETDIEIRTVRQPQIKTLSVELGAGKSWKKDVALPGVAGTNSLFLELATVEPLNLSSRLAYLLEYPHGCVEQLISKAFPQLYLKQFASLDEKQAKSAEESIKEVIRRLRSYQTAEGAFAYWPGETNTNSWGSVYAAHFLLEAEAKGYLVPEEMKRALFNNLRKVARDWKMGVYPSYLSEGLAQAYRLFVLALAKTPEVGAMNRMKEDERLTPMARWVLASSYALIGRADVADALIEQTEDFSAAYNENDFTFGSELRDKSFRLLTLALRKNGNEATPLARDVSKALASEEWYSTQSTAFGLVALAEYMKQFGTPQPIDVTYTCAGKTENVRTDKSIWVKSLFEKAGTSATVEIKNNGKSTLFASLVMEGIPAQGKEEAYANGISVAVSYVNENGQAVDVTKLTQGTNFTAVVTIKNTSPVSYNNMVLSEVFPAGWEILNTRYLNGAVSDSMSIAGQGINYQDIRDDRVYTYIDRFPAGRQITVRINLCAVYMGRFYLPPVVCEAMYNRLIRANTEGKEVNVE